MKIPAFGDLFGPTGILGDQPLDSDRRMLVDLDLQDLGENLFEFHDLNGFRPQDLHSTVEQACDGLG